LLIVLGLTGVISAAMRSFENSAMDTLLGLDHHAR
jgi:hypothetical protein